MQEITTNAGSFKLKDQAGTLPKGGVSTVIRENQLLVFSGNARNSWWKLNVPIIFDEEQIDTLEALQDKISSFSKGGGSTGEGVQWSDVSMLPEAGKIPVFSTQGLLSTGMPKFPENAIPLFYFDMVMKSYRSIIPVTSNRTLSYADAGFDKFLHISNNVKLTLPADSITFAIGSIINIMNLTVSSIEVALTGEAVIIVSDGDKKFIDGKSSAKLVYLGSNMWFLDGRLVSS